MKKLFKNIYIPALSAVLATACSSSDAPLLSENNTIDKTETVTFSFYPSLNSNATVSRTEFTDDHALGQGKMITTLIYAVFDKNGLPCIINPDLDKGIGGKPDQVMLQNFNFSTSETKGESIEIDLIRGLEFTVVFWAQSDMGAALQPDGTFDLTQGYFNTNDLSNIVFNRPGTFHNNDDARDAFCYIFRVTQYEDTREKSFELNRPFAQINVAVPVEMIDDPTVSRIAKSSIEITPIASNYNLFMNYAIENPDGGEFAGRARLNSYTIPYNMEVNGEKQPLIIYDRNKPNDEPGKYIWLSMSYILPPDYRVGVTGSTAYINLKRLTFYDENDEVLCQYDIDDVPALRNHRTNVILNSDFFVSADKLSRSVNEKYTIIVD